MDFSPRIAPSGQVNRIKRNNQRNQAANRQQKQALINAYLQKNRQRPAAASTPQAQTQPTDKTPLQAKRRENKRLEKRLKAAQQKQQDQLTALTKLKAENQRLRQQLVQRDQQLAAQAQQTTAQAARLQALRQELATDQRRYSVLPAYLALGSAILTQQEQRTKHFQAARANLYAEKRDWEQKRAAYKVYSKAQSALSKKEQTLRQVREERNRLRLDRDTLAERLRAAHLEVQRAHQDRLTVGDLSADRLQDWVNRLLAMQQDQDLRWLPAAATTYKRQRLQAILTDTSQETFGYFIQVNTHYVFKTLDGQTYRQYRWSAGPRTDVVYRGQPQDDHIVLTAVYTDVDPVDLTNANTQRLHRKPQPDHFAHQLPADAKQVLAGKRIMLVTWQNTQNLNRGLRAFGAEPLFVNNKEKAIPWIKARADSGNTDLTILMSEGLSHAVLETFDKQVIKARNDIVLVYHQRPEAILRLCYDHFKN